MTTRRQIQNRIDEIDRQLNAELERASVGDVGTDFRQFPGGTWTLAVLCVLWWKFGQMVPGVGTVWLHTHVWALYLGGLLVLLALWRTGIWLTKRRAPVVDEDFRALTARARELQAEKRDLQAQLKELQE